MDDPVSRVLSVLSALSLAVVMASCQGPTGGGTNMALLYGVTDYGGGGINNLMYPALDVDALAPKLSLSSGGIFMVTARTDSSATKNQIKADIDLAAASLDSDSIFLFYFGGHGIQGVVGSFGTVGHAGIAPYGVGTASGFSPSNMVTEDELRSWLSVLPTKKVIVILDACFSGGFIAMPGGNDGVPQDSGEYYKALWKAFLAGQAPQAGTSLSSWFQNTATDQTVALASWNKSLAAGSGFAADQAQLLTAAGSLEESWDSDPFQHGAFSFFLLEAQDNADFDGNGYVTVSEAYRYAFDGLQSRWNGIWGAVGSNGFATSPGVIFLPHLSPGPADYILFKK